MSVTLATMGMYKDCCGGAPGGGGAPPVHQYEGRGEDFPINVDVLSVQLKKVKTPEIKINIGMVRSERKD